MLDVSELLSSRWPQNLGFICAVLYWSILVYSTPSEYESIQEK